MATVHSEALGNAAGTAISIETGSTRNPRLVLESIRVENRDAASAWLNFYDAAAADVTPGTGRYGPPIHIPASLVPTEIKLGRMFRDAASVFASAAVDGTGVPTTGLRVDLIWRRVS